MRWPSGRPRRLYLATFSGDVAGAKLILGVFGSDGADVIATTEWQLLSCSCGATTYVPITGEAGEPIPAICPDCAKEGNRGC